MKDRTMEEKRTRWKDYKQSCWSCHYYFPTGKAIKFGQVGLGECKFGKKEPYPIKKNTYCCNNWKEYKEK